MQPESELEANAAFEQDFGGEPAAFNEFGASEGLLPAAQEGLHPVAQEGLHPVAQVGAPPVAQKGAPPAEEFEAIDPEFAHKLLRNETWSRPLTGSKRNKRHPLPTIAPSMVERVVELLARLRGLLNKRLPGQPELVKQGERLALDYLTRGKGAACASTSPFESWAEVNRTCPACAPRIRCMARVCTAMGTLLPYYPPFHLGVHRCTLVSSTLTTGHPGQITLWSRTRLMLALRSSASGSKGPIPT